jgi:hypothetical protein
MDNPNSETPTTNEIIFYAECDTPHWFGLNFPDLDVTHQLPFLTEDELNQPTPKITIDLAPGDYGIGGEKS